jgi:hypothetical protein
MATTSVIMTQYPDKVWLSDLYNKFIWTIHNRLTIQDDNKYYIFYVSNNNVKYANVFHCMNANGKYYYYNFQHVSARNGNPQFENLLIYDFNLENNERLQINANTWDGSHINISPDFNNLLLDYHYTIYNPSPIHSENLLNPDVAYPRHPTHPHYLRNPITIDHDYCRFQIAEWYYNNNPQCVGDNWRFNNIRGKLLRPPDGRNILNAGLPALVYSMAAGSEENKKQRTISSYYKKSKNSQVKIDIPLSKHNQVIIEKYSSGVCKYVELLAKEKNIELKHTSVVIFNPNKLNDTGLVILNCNINFEPQHKKYKKTSLKGYFKKEILTSNITDCLH